MKDIHNKVAAITGAGSGIGQALAVSLAKHGCHLALSDLDSAGLAKTVALLNDYPVKVTSQCLDVSQQSEVFARADKVVEDHGRVNLIFNNAGVALAGAVNDLSIDDYRWIININFYGALYGTKAFLPHLERAGEGHIVNISSMFGLASQPLMSGYNASKFALRGFTESLRQELDMMNSCVSATCVLPGCVKTNIAQATRYHQNSTLITGADEAGSKAAFERLFLTSAHQAAHKVILSVKRNKRRVLIGPDAVFIDLMVRCIGSWYQKVVVSLMKWQRQYNLKLKK